MNQNCPWSFLAPQEYNFCETQLCGWVNQPANTLSNVGYLIIAILIFRHKTLEKRLRNFFAGSLFFLFLGSVFFHGTGSVAGKMTDVSAMFIISMGILSLSIQRFTGWSQTKVQLFYGVGLALSLAFLFILKFGNVLFLAEILLAVIFEIRAQQSGRVSMEKKYFAYSIASLILSMIIWWLDMKKILCWPDQHWFSGHGIWHILTGVAMGLLYLSYVRGRKTETSEGP